MRTLQQVKNPAEVSVNTFREKGRFLKGVNKYKGYYILLIPGILYFLIFCYLPMFGILIAFENYSPFKGVFGSRWVGLANFRMLFNSDEFWRVFRNTFLISFYKLVFGFPAPLIFALLINELKRTDFKKVIQTISYLPHFISWPVFSGIIIVMLSPAGGIVNYMLSLFGIQPIAFLMSKEWFRTVLVVTSIWKEVGWGAIIYLASISNIDMNMYEAAVIDGANRWKQVIYITIPSLMGVTVTLFILRLGHILNAGFQQVLTLYNPVVYSVSDIFDTFVYRRGLEAFEFSYSTAVGLFKSVVGLILVIIANKLAKKMGESSIW